MAQNAQNPDASVVRFGRLLPFWGVLGGMVIAVGLPLGVLLKGAHLPSWAQVVLILAAVVMGGVVALVSAFFGIVIPRQVTGGRAEDPTAAEPAPAEGKKAGPDA